MRTFHFKDSLALIGICGIALLTGCAREQSTTTASAKDIGAPVRANEGPPRNKMVAEPVNTGVASSLFASPRVVTLPQGSTVRVRTQTTISTHSARNGETIQANLDAPLVANGVVLAPRGAEVTLAVADSDPGGRVKGRARIGLRLVSIPVAGERRSVVTSTYWHEAAGTKKKDVAKIGIMSGIGAAIGAIAGGGKGAAIGAGAGGGAGTAVVLSTHGDAAVIPAESVIQFRLDQAISAKLRN